jgi:hypothetical protein
MEQIQVRDEEGIRVWNSRAQALAIVDDASHNDAIALATLVGKHVTSLSIVDQKSYDEGVLCGSVLAKVEKRLVDWHKVRMEAAFTAHKRAVADQKEEVGPISSAKALAGTKVRTYEVVQEGLRREEEARLAAIARKAQEEEALATAAELRKQMEADHVPEAEIAEVEEEVVQEAIARRAPQPIAPATYEKSSAARKTTILWSARVISIRELCAAIGRNEQPESFALGLTKDTNGVVSSPNLNAAAKGQQQVKLTIPGVIGVSKESNAGFSTR